MNDIIKAMEERRSIRKFKPDMPSKSDIGQIIEAGLYAASARGKQSAIIVAVTNRELRDRISAELGIAPRRWCRPPKRKPSVFGTVARQCSSVSITQIPPL